jgi:hypothetical protein
MLAMQDFVPAYKLVSKEGLLTPEKENAATFGETLAAAATWIRDHQIRVINIETVVLPNMWAPGEQGSSDVALRVASTKHFVWEDGFSRWFQFIRVWYEAPEPPSPAYR